VRGAGRNPGPYRDQLTWRQGAKGKMSSRFAAWQIRPAHRFSAGKEPLAACWLLVEWPADTEAPTKYFFSNLPPTTSLKRLVGVAKSRWWIEHSYRELKDELGMDHFEGRSWRGWHHHAVLVLMAYAFLQYLRRRRQKKWSTSATSIPARTTPIAAGLLVRALPALRTNGSRTP